MEPHTEKTPSHLPKSHTELNQINPLIDRLRTNSRAGNGEGQFFTTRTKFR
jgi:hypothetical protein